MTYEIHRTENGNHRERGGRDGRIHVSRSIRIVWVLTHEGNAITEFDRLKDARKAYPDAKVIRD